VRWLAFVATVLCTAAVARADESTVTVEPDEVDAIAARLAGHTVEIAADRRAIRIVDVAGAGAPRVGVIAREGDDLVLVTAEGRWRLAGPLARPRIAGPGYTVWVIGTHDDASVPTLTARRLGILRRPALARRSN
jgi:hypothetical protein